MRACLITDTHWGARGDSVSFADYFNRFYYEYFFPYLKENNIKRIIHLGDIVERRKYINFMSLRHFRKFVETCDSNGIQLDVIVGNHDTFFKNTNDINCMKELFDHTRLNVKYYDSPTDIMVDDLSIAVLPWVCSDNYNESIEFLKNTNSHVLFGHLEIQGFEMHKGEVNTTGFETSLFSKFDVVCSGHFHHKSSKGNIHYLGCPYQIMWTDYSDKKGFHIFDTETRELEFIENPFEMFYKLHYDDSEWKTNEVIDAIDFSKLKNTYCKVIVHSKTNPYLFDMFIDRIEKAGALDIKVVDDHLNLNLENDTDIINEAEDTISIMRKVVEQIDTSTDKKKLDNFLTSLYNEAISIQG